MNEIDRQFAALVAEIQGLSEKELYHRIRANFDQVPYAIQKSCMDFFNQFNYWGRLDPQQGIYEEIEGKGAALFHHIQDFAWLYDHLADYRSKKTLYAILSNWYRYDFITTAQTKESLFDDYFDLDLVTCTPEEVFVETEGRIRRWEKSFESREQLLELIRQIVSRVNRTVNTASPIVDARLEDGSRVHVVLEPVALNGPILTIRKFPDPITMDRLLEYGSVTREAADLLKILAAARYNIFVSGVSFNH